VVRAAVNSHDLPAPGGRIARKRVRTRAALLESAYQVMVATGIEAATIKDITDRADVGFGTFYNYFESKDDLAAQLLDCVIHDLGRRNIIASDPLRDATPILVMPVSTRLVIRDATTNPVWEWWANRPDLLVARVREGLLPFARRDMLDGIERGVLGVSAEEVDAAWSLAVWLMVGGIHDIQLGLRAPNSDEFVVAAIMRMLGVPPEDAARISATALPIYPKPSIDWTFNLTRR